MVVGCAQAKVDVRPLLRFLDTAFSGQLPRVSQVPCRRHAQWFTTSAAEPNQPRTYQRLHVGDFHGFHSNIHCEAYHRECSEKESIAACNIRSGH
jgi:hypothetical protein